MTGINAVIFYSSEIFKDTGMSVFTATGIIYSVNMLAAVGSIFLLSFVGKRWTMICAQSVCCIGMTGIFLFSYYEYDYLLLGVSLVFIVGFELGPGSIGWPYVSEICNPKAIGIATMSNWVWTLLVGLTYPFMQSSMGAFANLVFAGLSLVGLIFYLLYMKETRGLTTEELSELYLPEHLKRGIPVRKYDPNEETEIGFD